MKTAAALEIAEGIWIDARRAVWLEKEQTLAVADLHLGYAWAHRHAGQLLPLSASESTMERLTALVHHYRPRQLAILGDVVHAAVPVSALEEELRRLCQELGGRLALRLLAGNHDRSLAPLLKRCGIDMDLIRSLEAGPHLLIHGDETAGESPERLLEKVDARGGWILMGHEHPALRVGDGITSVKCPCFLIAPGLLVLPAFSEWAAGANIRGGNFLSPLANFAKFREAYALLNEKLLPVRL
jgi:putative SbcD/Mre11-related phosphoesterase